MRKHALRKNARGQPCTLRVYGICNGRWETTVLAHLRMYGTGGMGMKPHDLCAVFACSSCHDWLDGRVPRTGGGEPRADVILRALLKTLEIQAKIEGWK